MASSTNSVDSGSRVSSLIRRCGVDDAGMLHRLSVETYVDTFDGTSSDADMRKFLEESYAEPILRDELTNPDSMFFVMVVPSCAQVGTKAQVGTGTRNTDDSVVLADFVDACKGDDSEVSGSGKADDGGARTGIPAGYMKLNFGDAQIEDMGPGAMEIQRLYIQKAFKGHGFGTRLMNLALKTARERDLHKVWLGVWEHNEPAKRFYSGKGFVRVGQHAFWQGDDKQTDYLMAREV